jgi:hypothetical protein
LSKKELKTSDRELDNIFKELVGDCKIFPNLAIDVAHAFKTNMDKIELGALLDDYGYDTLEDAEGYIFDSIKENPDYKFCYEGAFGDDGEPFEAFLCDADIDYKDENIIISKAGGY